MVEYQNIWEIIIFIAVFDQYIEKENFINEIDDIFLTYDPFIILLANIFM
jgi:hypothetical protein